MYELTAEEQAILESMDISEYVAAMQNAVTKEDMQPTFNEICDQIHNEIISQQD